MITVAHEEHAVTVTPRNRANFRRLKTNSIQSYKRWEKENELLYAMMEDESEWLAKLFPDVVVSPDFFFYALEDGSLLCRLANYIQEKAETYCRERKVAVPGKKFRYHTMGKCNKEIKLFKSRENVQQFLTWCRSHGIPEAILFESNDVVQVDDYREGCRGVIICLMEIVRRTAKFELDELPQLIQMEKEIEEEEAKNDTDLSDEQGQILDVEQMNMSELDNLEVHQTDQPEIQSPSSLDSDSGVDSVFDQEEGDNTVSRLTEFSVEESEERTKTTAVTRKQTPSKPKDRKSCPKSQRKTDELPSLLDSKGPKSELDKQVCKLAKDYNIKVVRRLKEGKYIILGRIMFVRMLNDHMLVRIGGGWDTLEHYLMTHVPSKQALENSSATPSSQAPTSPRNSISTGTGGRNSLFDKVKRREQIGVINRDSPVYSSQGSLSHPLASQSTPNLREKSKKLSIVESDKKDITDAIRKIESSVSQNLASRPVSFTSKAFHQLKSRFDKGIFGSSRRTSSPDLSLKGKKILRRMSDTSTMADIATTLSFDRMNEDQQQIASGNNNDADLKQPEFGDESFPSQTTAPSEDLFGNETHQSNELISVDETDGSDCRGDIPSSDHAMDSNWTDDLLGGPPNGHEKFQAGDEAETAVDVSSFDPFTPTCDQVQLISTENEPSNIIEGKSKAVDDVEDGAVVGNGHLESESVPVHETAEMHDELIATEANDNALELTPRIDLGDLLADSQPVDQITPELQEPTEESSPPFEFGDPLVDTKSVEAEKEGYFMKPSTTDYQISEVEATNPLEEVTSDGQFDGKDVQDVPSIEVDPVVGSPLQEEATKLEEPVPSEESAVNSEGESTTPVSDKVTSEEQSQEIGDVFLVKEDESREETCTSENEERILEEEAKPAELEATPVMEEAKSAEAEVDSVEEEAKVGLEDVQSVREKSSLTSEEVMPVEDAKFTEEKLKSLEEGGKPSEIDAMPAKVQMEIAKEEGQTSVEEVKPVQKEAKPAEVYAFMPIDEGLPPVVEEAKSTEEEVKSLKEEVKPLEIEARSTEVEIKNSEEEGNSATEDVRSVEEEVKPIEKEAKPVEIYALNLTNEEVTPVEEEAKSTEGEVNSLDKEVKPGAVETGPCEPETKPSEEETQPPLKETKPSGEELKPVEETAKPAEIVAFPTDKKTDKFTKTKPQSVGAISAKSPTKAIPSTGLAAAKKQPGPTKLSSGTSKKDVKAPVTKAPASKPNVATKAPATKSTTTTPGTKKPISKAAATKTAETKKPERPKSAATARPPTKSSVTGTTRPASASPHKVPASTTKPPARKAASVDSTDSGTPKSAPKTTASRPASTKLTQVKTSSPVTKPTSTKPSRPQSAKPSDKLDGAIKTPNSRPQSAKPKSTTTTTTNVKKTTTTKTGTAPVKTTTTKTVTEVKNGPVKTSTTTTRPTKPSLTAKTTAKPTMTDLKSKPGVKTSATSAKPSTKSPPKKKVDEVKEKQKQIKLDELVSKEEKIVELEATEKGKPPETVGVVSEERPMKGSPEEKLIELTPVSAFEQASQSAEVSSEGVFTQIVTSQTTTVVADGEKQTATTTTEEFAFEQLEGES